MISIIENCPGEDILDLFLCQVGKEQTASQIRGSHLAYLMLEFLSSSAGSIPVPASC